MKKTSESLTAKTPVGLFKVAVRAATPAVTAPL
jgi:hypothetical protein